MSLSEQFVINQLDQIPAYHRVRINNVEVLKTAIKGITMQQLLFAEVVKKGYDKVPIVVETTNKLKKQVFLKSKMQNILSEIQISDSSLEMFYEKNLSSFEISR